MDNQDSKDRELISAAVDGELSEFELRRLLQTLESDSAREKGLLQDFARWNWLGDMLRADRDAVLSPSDQSFITEVRLRIGQQSGSSPQAESADVGASSSISRPSWLNTLAGLSVAATVAAVVVLGYQGFSGEAGMASRDDFLAIQPDISAENTLHAMPSSEAPFRADNPVGGGLDLVSAESIQTVDGWPVVSDPLSQRYAAYVMLHSAMNAQQQNALVPMTRAVDIPLKSANP